MEMEATAAREISQQPQGLLASLENSPLPQFSEFGAMPPQAAVQSRTDSSTLPPKTKPQPASNKNKETFVYYPQPTPHSPDVSHLPLPPNLHRPISLRLIATISLSIPMKPQTQSTQVRAFEVSTPAALLHSIHHYFAPHISTNCQARFRPVFTQVSLQHSINIPPQAGNKTQKQLVDSPITGKLMTENDYAERFLREASGKSLKRVVICVDWRRDDEESPDEDEDEDEDEEAQEMNALERALAASRRDAHMPTGYRGGVSESFLRRFGSRRNAVIVPEDGEEEGRLFDAAYDLLSGSVPRAQRMVTTGQVAGRTRPIPVPSPATLMTFRHLLLDRPVGPPPPPGGFF